MSFYSSLPSLSFSSVYAGKLKITLSTVWIDNWGDPIGRSGTSNVIIRAQVTAHVGGASIANSSLVDKIAGSAILLLDYPGGGVVWDIAVVVMSSSTTATGAYSQGLNPITLTAELTKK